MSIKNEYSLSIDPETRKTTGKSDAVCAKTYDKKAEVKSIVDPKLNMPFKTEHPLNNDPEIKKTTVIDDCCAKTKDKKAEVKSDDGCAKTQDKKVELKKIVDTKLNLPVNSEQLLKFDPEIKKTGGVSDDGCAESQDIKAEEKNDYIYPGCAESQDKKAEVKTIDVIEPEPVVERPIFKCLNCNMTERYDYFSDHTPYNRNVRTKIDYYLTRDPFSPRTKRQVLILGSVCSLCNKDCCIKPECSIFYSKFYCSTCARQNIANFPYNVQNKIKAARRI